MIDIALVEPDRMTRNTYAAIISSMGNRVMLEAESGRDFSAKLAAANLPQLVVLNVGMPEKNGPETIKWVKQNCPGVKVIAVGLFNDESLVIRMFMNGALAAIQKASGPLQLKAAIHGVHNNGYYYADHAVDGYTPGTMLNDDGGIGPYPIKLNEREKEFLKYTCTELTYKEIAARMFVSPRTVDGYREALFEKLNVRTRVGLVIYAIKNGIVTL